MARGVSKATVVSLLTAVKAERDRRQRIRQVREMVEAGVAEHGTGFWWDVIADLRKLANKLAG
jgi:hypothetical protein